MADTNASQAGRELVRARWGDTVLRRAAATVLERADGRLPDAVAAELERIAGDGQEAPGE